TMLGLGVYLLLPQVGNLRESVRVMRGLRPWAVALAVAAQVLSFVAFGFMMRRIVELTGQHLRLRRAVAVTVASGSVGLVAGGLIGIGGSSYRWLRDGGIRAEGAVLAGWLPALLNGGMVAVAAMLGIGQLMLLRTLNTAQWVGSIFSLLVIGFAVGLTWWGSHHHAASERIAVRVQARWAKMRRKRARPEQLASTIEGLFDAMELLKRRGWKGPLMGSAAGVALDAATLYFVLLAARHPVTLGVLMAGYGIPRLIGKVGVIPGGVGLVEAMMVAIFTGGGVPTAPAVSVVLGYRVLAFWMPNLAGFIIMPALQATARVRVPRPLSGAPPGTAAGDARFARPPE
ncbi:MAG TPA: YbhN family protein, partial [Longimicrobiaceae bacterium]|nr:YbhN family protein [Longimicrobiaceae bacterium]